MFRNRLCGMWQVSSYTHSRISRGGEIFQVRDVPRVVAKYSMTLGGVRDVRGGALDHAYVCDTCEGDVTYTPDALGGLGEEGGGLAQISVTPGGGSGSGDGERIFP